MNPPISGRRPGAQCLTARQLTARQKELLAIGLYLLGFCVLAGAMLLPFVQNGRFLIHGTDGFRQHFPVFQYLHDYYREIAAQLLRGDWNIPLFDFTIGYGEDILTTLNYYGLGDPLYLIAPLVPEAYLPHAFSALVMLRFLLAGLFFYGFGRQLGKGRLACVAGGWLYAFSGLLYQGMSQTVFTHAVPLFPLLLWGAARCIQKKSPLLLALAAFVSGLCGFYFLTLSAFGLAVAVLAMSAGQRHARPFRGLVEDILRCVLPYLAGLLLSMALLLPQIFGFFSSSRNAKEIPPLFAGLGALRDDFLSLLQPGGWLGLAAPALLGMLLLLAGRGRLPQKLALAAAFLPVVSPFIAGAMVLFTRHGTDNWWYMVCFAAAWSLTLCFGDLGRLTRAQRIVCAAGCGLYLVLLWQRSRFADAASLAIALPLAACLALVLAFGPERRWAALRSRRLCAGLLCGVLLTGHAAGLYLWASGTAEEYRDLRFAAMSAPLTADQLPDPALYRVDTGDVSLMRWWAGANAPMRGGYNGLSAYFSLLNANTLQALDEWNMAPDRQEYVVYHGVDLCAALETLSSVRYLFLRDGEEDYLPYGFVYVGDTPQSNQFSFAPEGGTVLHRYENQYMLPLGYTYDRWISEEEYLALDGFAMQAAMLHAAVLSEAPASAALTKTTPALQGLQPVPCETVALLDCVPDEANGATGAGAYRYAAGSRWLAEGTDPALLPACPEDTGLVVLRLEVPANSEVHLCMPDLAQKNGYFGWGGIELAGRSKPIFITDPNSRQGSNLSRDAWVNLGYFEEAETLYVGLHCPQSAPTRFGEVCAAAWDMADYAAAASALGETVLQDVAVTPNNVAGLLNADSDCLLVLSIPYSPGWRAVIDGVSVTPQRANRMFMALEVPAGEHVIGLYYITPGLKPGLALSALGLLTLAAQLWWYHRGKRGRGSASTLN